MANVTTGRLSPAELRRKLLAPPTDAAPTPAPTLAETPLPTTTRLGTRRVSDSMTIDFDVPASGSNIELNTMTVEQLGAARLGVSKMTPMPTQRLDLADYNRDGTTNLFEMDLLEATPMASYADNDEVSKLREKNAELRRIIDELKPVMEEATALEQKLQQQEQQFQAEIANRDQQIQALQEHLQQIEEQLTNAAPPMPKTSSELEEWADELEKESAQLSQQRQHLDADRKQLREDEESLERQMRQTEVQMARERAMMARQETELKRLSAEIQHELEIMQRGDGALREQLAKFQRRHQDVLRAGNTRPQQ